MSSNRSTEDDFDPNWEKRLAAFLRQPSTLFNQYRLAILLNLYHADTEDYSALKRSLDISDGHLSNHLRALMDTKLIESRKERFEDRRRTMFHITPDGISALEGLFVNLDRVRGRIP